MRKIQVLHPTDGIPGVPDTVNTILLAAGTGQDMAWPSTAANIMRVTFMSTAGVSMGGYLNPASTAAAVPSSGSSSSTAAAVNIPVLGQASFQIPMDSTGFSVVAPSSCRCNLEFWAK